MTASPKQAISIIALLSTRNAGAVLWTLLCLLICAPPAWAQSYPSRPITYIMPFPPGNSSDQLARALWNHIQKKTGKTIVIENRPGAVGIIGTKAAMRAPADGYTLVMASSGTHSVGPVFSTDADYDPVKDFTHIAIYARTSPAILVAKDSPFKTIDELIAYVKANPKKLAYAFSNGSGWVIGARFHKLLGLDSRVVPYKASQDALLDIIGRRIDYMIADGQTAANAVDGGQGRALVVLSDQKYGVLPNVPFMKEAGLPPMPLSAWAGVAGPAGIPDEARQWVRKALEDALNDPELRETMTKMANNIPPPGIEPAQFVADQLKLWTEAAKESGVAPQ